MMNRLYKKYKEKCPCYYFSGKHGRCTALGNYDMAGYCEDGCPFIFWNKIFMENVDREIVFRKFTLTPQTKAETPDAP